MVNEVVSIFNASSVFIKGDKFLFESILSLCVNFKTKSEIVIDESSGISFNLLFALAKISATKKNLNFAPGNT